MLDQPKRRRKGTNNRIICWLMWWYWESHSSNHGMSRVILVYSFTEYLTYQRHVWVEDYSFSRTLWWALGMAFVGCKSAWDGLEKKLWPEEKEIADTTGM